MNRRSALTVAALTPLAACNGFTLPKLTPAQIQADAKAIEGGLSVSAQILSQVPAAAAAVPILEACVALFPEVMNVLGIVEADVGPSVALRMTKAQARTILAKETR